MKKEATLTQEPPVGEETEEPPPLRSTFIQQLSLFPPSPSFFEYFSSTSFPISHQSQLFLNYHYPTASQEDWASWKWQLKNRITSLSQLQTMLTLSDEEIFAIQQHQGNLPLNITPYYASLLHATDPTSPLRRCVIPSLDEYLSSPGEAEDPLGEEHDSPVPCIVHRYPDRVLFLVTEFCSVFCRYCTRSRMVGKRLCHSSLDHWGKALDYIQTHPEVRDVLISGGDPLTMSDEKLDWLLSRLRAIPHVDMIRIGTKVPAVLPQRITPSLLAVLKKYHPLWISLHFAHPDELTQETRFACEQLADAGIPLGSQTVLLKGINDSVDTLKKLFLGLLKMRVRPYYLYQCDPIMGSHHFRTSVQAGLDMIKGLRGHITGYAIPHYVIDAPNGGGKIPLLPDYCVGQNEESVILKNYQDQLYYYPKN